MKLSCCFFVTTRCMFPESHDVAVILPELIKAFSGRLQAAVIAKPIERELQARFRFTSWPSLVFLRNGEYLGVIAGIRDWQEYQAGNRADFGCRTQRTARLRFG